MAASFLLSPGGPSGTSSGRSLEKNSPRIRAERRTGALKVPVLPHALQPLGALWAYERLLYNVRCPAGCRPGFTYLVRLRSTPYPPGMLIITDVGPRSNGWEREFYLPKLQSILA